MQRYASLAFAVAIAGCTPGASGFQFAGASGTSGTIVTIDVDLTKDPGASTPAGPGAGYKPVITTVSIGDLVQFRNSDGFAHTATAIAGATTFPSAYPFTASAIDTSGSKLSTGFSTGTLPAGNTSQRLLADKAGTYLFGCFYHYGSPMRAEIVVQ